MQYLAANRTNASGSNADVGEKINLPTVYRSAETNTARCGISCAALGWNLTSAHTAAYAASGAKVNMCTTGKDDCTGSSSSMIALGETSTRRELYAISYGTLKLPILRSHNGVYSGRAAFVEKTDSHYTGLGFVNGDDIEINHDGTSYDPQYAESHQVSATLWNTANTVYTKIGPMCSGITGGTSADQSSRGIGSTGLRYTMYDSNGNATQDIIIKENAVNTFGDPVTTIAFPLNKYEDIGWWCDTSGIVPPANDSWNERGGLGWNLTINPNGGTYNGTTGTTTLKMQWGSRQFNKITPPTRTGYKFIGIYNTSSDTGGTAIYTVAGKAAVTSNSPYWTSTIEWPYTLWSGTYNKQTESAITGWARWEIKSTTISFVSQGTTVSSRKYTFEDEIVAPSATTRTGYSFSQWCSGTNCYGPTTQYGGSVMKPARIDSYLLDSSSWTFTATWTANKYTISFDARTDQSHATAPNPDPVNVYYDSSVTANLPNDSKFAGWYTKSTEGNIKVFNADGSPVRGSTYNGTTYFNSSGKWNCTRNVTLYARYN